MVRINRKLKGGYTTLSQLLELHGYTDLREFENDFDIEANYTESNNNLFFNAKKYSTLNHNPEPRKG